MSDTPNNHGVLGLAALLLLLGRQSGSGAYGNTAGLAGIGNLSALGKSLQLNHFARDMHRVVAMMDQVEGLTQMIGSGQLASSVSSASAASAAASAASAASRPRITGAADSVSDAFSTAMNSLSNQDLSQLMELAGPLMTILGNGSTKK